MYFYLDKMFNFKRTTPDKASFLYTELHFHNSKVLNSLHQFIGGVNLIERKILFVTRGLGAPYGFELFPLTLNHKIYEEAEENIRKSFICTYIYSESEIYGPY